MSLNKLKVIKINYIPGKPVCAFFALKDEILAFYAFMGKFFNPGPFFCNPFA